MEFNVPTQEAGRRSNEIAFKTKLMHKTDCRISSTDFAKDSPHFPASVALRSET